MGMLRSHICSFTPLSPLSLYPRLYFAPLSLHPVSYPTPLPRYPAIPEDSLCESL